MATNLIDLIVIHDNSTPPNGTKHGVKKKFQNKLARFFIFFRHNGKQLDILDCYISKDHNFIEKREWVSPQYNEPHPTPLFLSKGQGFEIGN
jgi:hypothetical protein